ncbi:MAG TPA: hypothetical protein ENJ37_03450 [Deltaproteobacteria bacterium]|nr:hypothetical protein [Deltaproteobacteria bacterium]
MAAGGSPWTTVAAAFAAFAVCLAIFVAVGEMEEGARTERPVSERGATAPERAAAGRRPGPAPSDRAGKKTVDLFFARRDGPMLAPERVEIEDGPLFFQVEEALSLLLEGPGTPGLARTVPPGTRLLELRIKDGTAYVDLSFHVVGERGEGAADERMTVYSIVNTVTLNFPRIRRVQILVDGKVMGTLRGGVEISSPLGPSRALVKAR